MPDVSFTLCKPRALLAAAAVAMVLATGGQAAQAQGWSWPWDSQPQRPPPVPQTPIYRGPQGGTVPVPIPPSGGYATSGNRPAICLQLEQRLALEASKGSQNRDALPRIEQEIRGLERQMQPAQRQLESGCWETFFFSRQLVQSRRCIDANATVEQTRRRISELETQRQQLISSSGRSYQDDIIRELARNNCGANYNQEAARRGGGGGLFGGWLDEDGGSGGGLGISGTPIGTYRTVCVRLCDGYYFPVSFSTLPAHFERDEELCKSRCAAPAELYYYQNPGGTPDQMVAFRTRERIQALKSAFRFKKEYVQGCSCKTAEYLPSAVTPDRRADAQPGTATAAPVASTTTPPRTTGSTLKAPLPPQ